MDKTAAAPKAFDALQQAGYPPATQPRRPVKSPPKGVEQDHRLSHRPVKLGVGVGAFHTAWRTVRGDEVMPLIRQGQARAVARGDVLAPDRFIAQLFGIAA